MLNTIFRLCCSLGWRRLCVVRSLASISRILLLPTRTSLPRSSTFVMAHRATTASAGCFVCLIRTRWRRLLLVSSRRCARGLDPAAGVVAVDGKSLRRGYERGRRHMPPLMVSVWDAETRLSLATRHAPGGNEVAATLAAL